jgi:DNA (cytosine-5)-methyltransferase 1
MKLGSLFTGYGGLCALAAGPFFDAETAWCSDIDPGACKIIAHRFPGIPNLGDITRIDWTQVEPVDVLTGGWPCQPFSHAGKRRGAADERALWPEVARAVRTLRPRHVFLENVAAIASAGELARAAGDLAKLGYVGSWRSLRAADVGAPHGRLRTFILAESRNTHGIDCERRAAARQQGETRSPAGPATDTKRVRLAGRGGLRDLGEAPAGGAGQGLQRQRDWNAAHDRSVTTADADSGELPREWPQEQRQASVARCDEVAWGDYEPAIRRWESIIGRAAPTPTEAGPKGGQRLAPRFVEWMQGLPEGWVTDVPGLSRIAQLKALGNGVVPQQAAAALRMLTAMEAAA